MKAKNCFKVVTTIIVFVLFLLSQGCTKLVLEGAQLALKGVNHSSSNLNSKTEVTNEGYNALNKISYFWIEAEKDDVFDKILVSSMRQEFEKNQKEAFITKTQQEAEATIYLSSSPTRDKRIVFMTIKKPDGELLCEVYFEYQESRRKDPNWVCKELLNSLVKELRKG
ncbi:hypothetical protein L6261_04340 [Candidatus Parcubacteria bacterium]|nr:hypothetical protein [Candidatus Parcubacteria bacterium]